MVAMCLMANYGEGLMMMEIGDDKTFTLSFSFHLFYGQYWCFWL